MDNVMNDTPGPNIALMKWIVIILGILIVVFTAVIGVKMYTILTATDEAGASDVQHAASSGPASSVPASSTEMAAFADLDIPLPENSTIVNMTASENRLFIHVQSDARGREILVIDALKGEVTGRIRLTPSGAGK